ncbi:hypothetical protein [Pseudomonas sp. GD03944]|uniref:hypothetical protein n=1 Tax=Pseudomonas sp. GD03944 TaxID=2975409 RepID=UPI002449A8A1|nr:hypothetical protein [Pseudomonas sp. GD03944]MDH1262931.1 hypothetical protein [Pseudomonas sp. GD03944]
MPRSMLEKIFSALMKLRSRMLSEETFKSDDKLNLEAIRRALLNAPFKITLSPYKGDGIKVIRKLIFFLPSTHYFFAENTPNGTLIGIRAKPFERVAGTIFFMLNFLISSAGALVSTALMIHTGKLDLGIFACMMALMGMFNFIFVKYLFMALRTLSLTNSIPKHLQKQFSLNRSY